MSPKKGTPGRGQPTGRGAKMGEFVPSDNIIAHTNIRCQVLPLVGQAAVLAYRAWLSGHFRKAAAHNAVFLALLDLAGGGS